MNTKPGPTPNRANETNALERAMQVALQGEERRRRSMFAAWASASAWLAIVRSCTVSCPTGR